MEQAKARNPNIKLYGLAWGAPGWIGNGNFWSTDMINYLLVLAGLRQAARADHRLPRRLERARLQHPWYEQLRSALNSNGYSDMKIVGADSGWWTANDVDTNSAFAPRSTSSARTTPAGTGRRADQLPGAVERHHLRQAAVGERERLATTTTTARKPLARGINRGYIDGKMTAYLNWPIDRRDHPEPPVPDDGSARWPRSRGPATTRSARTPG